MDLFVRASNKLGLEIYTKLGYIVYRRVLNYYWGLLEDEDAFGKNQVVLCFGPPNAFVYVYNSCFLSPALKCLRPLQKRRLISYNEVIDHSAK